MITDQQVKDARFIIEQYEKESQLQPTPNCIPDYIHKDLQEFVDRFNQMETMMRIKTFMALRQQILESLYTDTKYNEEHYCILKEKTAFIDDTIKRLSV